MNFEADDLDWALGELLALIWRGKVAGIPAHELHPTLFHSYMRVVNAQPFAVRQKVREIITDMQPLRVMRFGHEDIRAA